MKNEISINHTASATSVLERIAQGILIAHAWMSSPAMTDRERIQRELLKAEAAGTTGAGITG